MVVHRAENAEAIPGPPHWPREVPPSAPKSGRQPLLSGGSDQEPLPQPSEPFLFPKLRNYFADFP